MTSKPCTLPISVNVALESDGPLALRLTISCSYPEDLLKNRILGLALSLSSAAGVYRSAVVIKAPAPSISMARLRAIVLLSFIACRLDVTLRAVAVPGPRAG